MRVRLVVFDVDGTLYQQTKLRAKMIIELFFYILRYPLRLQEIVVIREYRRVHENFGPDMRDSLDNALVDEVCQNLSMDPEEVRQIIDEWLFHRPLKHLRNQCVPEIESTLGELGRRGIRVTVLSDHNPISKLKALGLEFDNVYYATRADLNCLKPNPKLLLRILSDHQVNPDECVMIGDRNDRDGALARAVGARFVLYPNRGFRGNLLDAISQSLSSHVPV